MFSQRHLPATVLCLTILSAVAVLAGGWHFAKVETRAPVERDRAPLTSFTSAFLEEIRSLETLYFNHLDDIRAQALNNASRISIAGNCRNIIGIEQASILGPGRSGFSIDLREDDRTTPLPEPYLSGYGDNRLSTGFLVDPAAINSQGQWIEQPGHSPHYIARLSNDRILALRIDTDQTAAAMDNWLSVWIPDAFAAVDVSGIQAEVVSPRGTKLAGAKMNQEEKPSLLLPIQCAIGRWHIASWDEYQTLITYRQPVLIGTAALALLLTLTGVFGFIQQNRAFRLAEQRVSFVNRVSHELRTPMTNILLNLDLLADSIRDKSQRTEKSLGLIRDETERLSRLLANVLTFSRNEKETGTRKAVTCDIPTLVQEVVNQFTPSLERKGIVPVYRFDEGKSRYALGDPDAIRQIIGNLISNVEKYGPVNESFEIEVSQKTKSGNLYSVVAVTDHGQGIKSSKRAQIFKPFVRLNDSTTEGVSGTGLGLAIARDLAVAMDGSLTVTSPLPGKSSGTRFELTLPLSGANIVSIAS
ncbi:MAG: HAMP domain-containing sensor histidine kinase [Verrucomicrobiales bacterium]|nr:HAMP domain-containing sensor histidine kinase [Verrucomicrobiales bacterium]